jgi:hypothetical protein
VWRKLLREDYVKSEGRTILSSLSVEEVHIFEKMLGSFVCFCFC